VVASAVLALPSPSGAQSPSLEPAMATRIDSVFAPYTAPGSPGCAVGVYRGGAIAFARGYGLADLQHGAPITPRTPFTTGSLSKQFTAASVLWLAREGKLSLDDPVRRHVPELDPMHDAGPVTVRQLIHHTSGMRDWWALVDLAGMRFDDGYRPDDVLALAARQKALNFPPGTAYAYSNTSYIVLGLIVQRVSGVSLRAFADSVFFRPLGMPVTRFLDDHTELIVDRAAAYAPRAGGYALSGGTRTSTPAAWAVRRSCAPWKCRGASSPTPRSPTRTA
jgi:CubicO group peptidase (beta-lactamase class C family)